MRKTKQFEPFPVLEHMTVKQVREYLQRSQSIILPTSRSPIAYANWKARTMLL